MGPTETTAMILIGVAVMTIAAIAVQQAEDERRERHIKILNLLDQTRGIEHILLNLPILFQTPALRSCLINALKRIWQTIIQLERSEKHRYKLDELTAMESVEPSDLPLSANNITYFSDRNSAMQARAMIRESVQILAQLHQTQQVQQTTAYALAMDLKRGFKRCSVDITLLEALEQTEDHGPRVALHKFRGALMVLKRLNKDHSLSEQIANIRQLIAKLEAEAQALMTQAKVEKTNRD
jgi:hypothetical protein